MKTTKLIMAIAVSAGLAFGVVAQAGEKKHEEQEINSSAVPSAVQQAADSHAKGGKIVRWKKEGPDYEAVIEKNGKERNFKFDANGKMLMTGAGSTPFENPFCRGVEMTFSDKGSYWGAPVATIINGISNDQELETIIITDTSDTLGLGGAPINFIKLSAPAGSSGTCAFYYPSTQGGNSYTGNTFVYDDTVHKTAAPGIGYGVGPVAIYTAHNIQQTSTLISGSMDYHTNTPWCPPDGHLGNWTLEIRYPDFTAATATYTKRFKICFKFK